MSPTVAVVEPGLGILIVDDEPRLRANLETLLAGAARRIATAASGREAMAMIEGSHFDLVVTDVRMGEGDGFALLEWVKTHEPRTLVIVITAYGSMESTIKAMRMGAFDYLTKPFDLELLSIAVERALRHIASDRSRDRAIEELELWAGRLQVINTIGRSAAAALSERELYDVVARALHDQLGYHHVYFATASDDGRMLEIRGQAGAYEAEMAGERRFPAGTGLTGKVIVTGQRMLVNDVRGNADYYELVPQTRAQVALPIRVDERTVGALSVESTEPASFDRRDVTLLETLADMVGSSLATVRLFQKMKETKEFLEALVTSSADAIVTTDPHGKITYFSPGAESVYGYRADEVVGQAMAQFYPDGAAEAERIMDLLRQQERLKNRETVLRARDGRRVYASLSASLLKDRTGRVIGTLGVSKDMTERVELERQLQELTITDSLTGLHNQRYFFRKLSEEMERSRRQKTGLALMLFDLDRFKAFNDTHGHVEGNRLLREVGRRVLGAVRTHVDSSFRYGGDEFTVLLPDVVGAQAATVARRIQSAVQRGLSGGVTVSVGLVSFRAEMSAEEFVRLADQAMYESKRRADGRLVAG